MLFAVIVVLVAAALTVWVLLPPRTAADDTDNDTAGAGLRQAQQALDGSADHLEQTLARYGLALDWSLSDQSTALVGGMAKASLVHGSDELEAGHLDEAISSFAAVISMLEGHDHPETAKMGAAAHFLRGRAYERSSRNDEALADFRRAVELRPDLSPAREAMTRLGSPS